MTYKHKLSARLARFRSGLMLIAVLATACGDDPLAPFDGATQAAEAAAGFAVGQRIETPGSAIIRADADLSSEYVGTQPAGAQGVIVGGPVAIDGRDRWQVDFDEGPDGWASESYLTVVPSSAAGPLAEITVDPDTATLDVGGTVGLYASLLDSAGVALTGVVTWASSDPRIATVDTAGTVRGVGAGRAVITAEFEGTSGAAAVSVAPDAAFVVGQRVSAPRGAIIRSGATLNSTRLGKQPDGAPGTVTGGPVALNNRVRWEVDFDEGPDGWATEDYLEAAGPAPDVSVAEVEVAPAADTVVAGESVQLTAVARDASGATLSGVTMTWASRDTLIARASTAGIVTGVAAGTAWIVATAEAQRDSARVTVTPVPVATVAVSPATATVEAGATIQLTAEPLDADGSALAGRPITWASDNAGIALVDDAGLVTGVAAGTAQITAVSEGQTGSATVTVTTPPPPVRVGYYAAPDGTSGGDGSYERPWDLPTALGGGVPGAGDTLWLRGGTYRGAFRSYLSGTSGQPVVLRAYPGERAVIDGGGQGTSSTFIVKGDWTILWGLEFTNSDPDRTVDRPNTVVNDASHTKYINLVVHDGSVGFYSYTDQADVEVYGSIFYNNGWQGSDRGHGHALYVKSNTGPVVLRENVLFNQFGYGLHLYTNSGSGYNNGIRVEGNVAFNNGSLSSNSTSANLLVGGKEPVTGSVVTGNRAYFAPGISGDNLKVGYSDTRNVDLTFQDNYASGGSTVLDLGFWTTATIANNTLIGSSRVVELQDPSTAGHVWTANRHWRDPATSSWRHDGTSYDFADWRTATGIALTDQATAGTPGATRVFVQPNLYEPGRVLVTVYNWGQQGAATVDLGGFLPAGAVYDVRSVQNLFGAPLASGTFSGGSVSIPLAPVAPPAPVGMASSPAPTTGPAFDVFLITIR